jgi:predicted RNase H-like HicB family nuclease
MKSHYLAIVEDVGTDHAVGVWFPDLPGCLSAGDTFEEALTNAAEAASLWLEARGTEPWPKPRSYGELKDDPSFQEELKDFATGYVVAVVTVGLPEKAAA